MLVAFFLAFVWGFAGVVRDRNKALAILVTLVSGTTDAWLHCRIFT